MVDCLIVCQNSIIKDRVIKPCLSYNEDIDRWWVDIILKFGKCIHATVTIKL